MYWGSSPENLSGSQRHGCLVDDVVTLLLSFQYGSFTDLAFLASYVQHFTHQSSTIVFVFSFIATVPLAALVGFAAEELNIRVGHLMGTFLGVTFRNTFEVSPFTLLSGLTRNRHLPTCAVGHRNSCPPARPAEDHSGVLTWFRTVKRASCPRNVLLCWRTQIP